MYHILFRLGLVGEVMVARMRLRGRRKFLHSICPILDKVKFHIQVTLQGGHNLAAAIGLGGSLGSQGVDLPKPSWKL